MTSFRLLFVSVPLTLTVWGLSAHAQEEPDAVAEETTVEADSLRCISSRRIRRIRIVDDKNILIYLSANHIYHNELQNECGGLERRGTFSYNSNDGLFCAGDGIGAFSMNAWDDVRPDVRCLLGEHRRISKDEADEMRRTGSARPVPVPEAKPLPMPPPLVIGADEDAETDEEEELELIILPES